MTGVEYYHQNEIIPLASTSVNMKLAVSKRKARKIYGCVRTSAVITNDEVNSFSRNKAGITNIVAEYNGQEVGQSDSTVSSTSSEVFADMLKASHGGLMSMHTSALNNVQAYTFTLAEGGTKYSRYTKIHIYRCIQFSRRGWNYPFDEWTLFL
jgi:hypothetical protein